MMTKDEALALMESERKAAVRRVLRQLGGQELVDRMEAHERAYAKFLSMVQMMLTEKHVDMAVEAADYVARQARIIAVEQRWYVAMLTEAANLAMPTLVVIPDGDE